jgi:hypothetical protein
MSAEHSNFSRVLDQHGRSAGKLSAASVAVVTPLKAHQAEPSFRHGQVINARIIGPRGPWNSAMPSA